MARPCSPRRTQSILHPQSNLTESPHPYECIYKISIYVSIYLSNDLSIGRSIYLSIDRSIDRCIYRSIDQSIYRSIYRSIHLSIDRSIYRSIYLSIDPSIYRSIYRSIYLVYRSIDRSIDRSIYLYNLPIADKVEVSQTLQTNHSLPFIEGAARLTSSWAFSASRHLPGPREKISNDLLVTLSSREVLL